jgi:PHD/YefM family antitoxin component YafN of YafNO toxin-antitoxin module
MFKATVVASKLREQMAHYFDMVHDDEVVQILHRGGEIKVLMTQEHYLNLLSRLALYEKSPNAKTVPAKSSREIENAVRAKLQEHEREEELRDDTGRVGQKRARQA